MIVHSELGSKVLVQDVLRVHAEAVQVLDAVLDEAGGAADVELALPVRYQPAQRVRAVSTALILNNVASYVM